MSDRPALELADFSFAYAGADRWALQHVSCAIEPGTATRVVGENGSGKSTLMLALAGLLGDPVEGAARGVRHCRATRISSVFQDPQWRLSLGTVADEVAFGPTRQGWDAPTVDRATHEALHAVGLDAQAGRSADALSGGQMQRMAIAAALALRPDVLLVDEPLSQVSDEARPALTDAILGLTRHGTAVVVFEALPSLPEAAFDQTVDLHNGRVRPDGPAPDALEPALASPSSADGPVVAQADGVVIEIPESGFRLGPVDLSLHAAEWLHLAGPNGSGKTSLVKVLAGLDVPTAGCVRIGGQDTREMDYPFGRVAVAMQEPDRQLFASTVTDELAVGLGRLGLGEKEIDRRRGFAYQYARLGHLAGRNPLSLSGGQKRRLVAACAMAVEPAVLHLDELLAGLDAQSVASLAAGLDLLRERRGTAVVTTGGGAARLAPGRRLVLRDGRAFED